MDIVVVFVVPYASFFLVLQLKLIITDDNIHITFIAACIHFLHCTCKTDVWVICITCFFVLTSP